MFANCYYCSSRRRFIRWFSISVRSQSAGNQMVHVISSLLCRPWLAWVAVDVTDHDYCLSRSCLLVEMTWITCIKKLETCARESELHHTRWKVTVTTLERNRTCISLYYGEWRVYHTNPHHPDIYISTLICTESTTYLWRTYHTHCGSYTPRCRT